ncbi:sporulation integral membrane protein YtvI [Oceanobacillus bengalensis]|uniref:Sporulation integral membrane protein YtvI n=1 Tax=Oceanobacillus bengalensis TaxID=1435466 RepID=A0A494YU75_9BACI|nr:sporulation integral membrane protein YtvI [Oceanobacillus bengalensis]RKQ13663.1 sporulation integral membrane protein YtvI [Oceanobacillus bengalensis]
MRKIFTTKRIVIGIILIIVALILYFYSTAFMPFILAIITAFILEPIVKLAQKYLGFKKRFPAVVTAFILFIAFISFLAYISITRLVNETIQFAAKLPYYIVELNIIFEKLLDRFNETVAGLPPRFIEEMEKQITALFEWATDLTQDIIPLLAGWAQGIPNMIFIIIVYLIALFLISLDLPKYKEAFFARFEKENAEKVKYMLQRSTRFFVGFFKAQFLVSILIFIVTYIGLLIISPGNALLMALIIWFIDFVPFIGSIVILAPWGLFELVSGSTDTGVQLLILAAILLIIRRTVEPKVMGDQIGLPALPTLAGIWLGLYFFGVIGLIIGPLTIIAIYSAKEAGIIKLDFKI